MLRAWPKTCAFHSTRNTTDRSVPQAMGGCIWHLVMVVGAAISSTHRLPHPSQDGGTTAAFSIKLCPDFQSSCRRAIHRVRRTDIAFSPATAIIASTSIEKSAALCHITSCSCGSANRDIIRIRSSEGRGGGTDEFDCAVYTHRELH